MDAITQRVVVRRVMQAIVATVHEAGPRPVPESMVHLALQTQGVSYDTCTRLIGALLDADILRRDAHHQLTLGKGAPS